MSDTHMVNVLGHTVNDVRRAMASIRETSKSEEKDDDLGIGINM